jgi:hypothetical protein
MSKIDAPGWCRIVASDDGQPVAESLDDGSGHPLPTGGHPVVRVRTDRTRLLGYQDTGCHVKLPGGQVVPSGVETELL